MKTTHTTVITLNCLVFLAVQSWLVGSPASIAKLVPDTVMKAISIFLSDSALGFIAKSPTVPLMFLYRFNVVTTMW